MINLIPPDARKAITKEYWLRVAVVWLFLTAAALVVVAVLKVPAYALINSQAAAFSEQFASAQQQQSEFKESEALISDANTLAQHLNAVATTTSFSTYRATLDSLATGGVSIQQFSFRRSVDGVGDIIILGNAATRADLAAFKDIIATHELFSDAILPIANLAQDKNINFSITVVPAVPEK